MYAGVSGLRNHQLSMDVIGNNIANVNTYGYKAARASFADMFSQRLTDATAANVAGTLGGMNPRQVGLGSLAGAIDVVHTVGAFQTTDRALDLTIIDEGFFTVTDGTDKFYTRAGNLYIDSFGYLVTSGGQYLLGMMLVDQDTFNSELMEEVVHTRITEDEEIVWDNLDNYATMTERNDEGAIPGLPVYGSKGDDGSYEADEMGYFGRIVIPTYFRQISIDESGVVKGIDETGNAVEIAVLVTATFMNTGGLIKMGDNLYRESSNSGTPGYSFPGLGPSGALKAGGLEMSNVDLANEFTSMIVTQRGYQANSRVITVSDTLLEELINLKR
jgi:flagellar hook protein FlgE